LKNAYLKNVHPTDMIVETNLPQKIPSISRQNQTKSDKKEFWAN